MQLYIVQAIYKGYYDVVCNNLVTTCRYDEIDTALNVVMRPYLRCNIKTIRASSWHIPMMWRKA